jgi:Sarcosine oxidase, delta subunit family.
MSFQLNCPNCGKRAVSEFTFKSEFKNRPAAEAEFLNGRIMFISEKQHGTSNRMVVPPQWLPKAGFLAERDTLNNSDHKSFWYGDLGQHSKNSDGEA